MKTRKLTEVAICVALCVVLNFLVFFKMPQGGSISIALLPLFIIFLRYEFKYGLIACIAFATIDFIIGGAFALHPLAILLDYYLAVCLLLSYYIFKKLTLKNFIYFCIIVVFASFLKYISHSVSGVLVYGEYADKMNVYYYSFIYYNLPYNGISTILVLIAAAPLYKYLKKISFPQDVDKCLSTCGKQHENP